MNLKNGFVLFLFSALLLGMVSCLGNGTEYESITITDAQITALSLSHDSIPALAKTKFSINQVEGIIFNYDSLPYLTNLKDSLLKITYITGSGLSQSLQLTGTAIDGSDSIYWKASADSIRLINNELRFTVFAPDSTNGKKEYFLKINIHQIDPDSVIYTQISSSELPFPAPDFGNDTLYIRTYFGERWTYVEDLQHVWAAEDEHYADPVWTNLANTQEELPVIAGGIAFYYNNEIWFMGGKEVPGDVNNLKIYSSQDGGVVWKARAAKVQPAFDFTADNAGIAVDNKGQYFYIVTTNNIWKAAINSRLFDH